MSGHQCTENPPNLDPNSGSGHVEKLGGLDAYVSGSTHSKLAVLLVSHVFGYETPNLRKLADKVAEVGFYAVVPDFFHGDPYNPNNQDRPLHIWIIDHGQDKGFEDSKPVVEALKNKGITAIGAAGFCWGAKVAVELAKQELVEAAVLLHPSRVTVDDIKGVKVPTAVLGAEFDQVSPPELVKQFEEILASKPDVKSFVKIFPRVKHGWTVRYNVNDPLEVEAAEKAHKDMLAWLIDHVRFTCKAATKSKVLHQEDQMSNHTSTSSPLLEDDHESGGKRRSSWVQKLIDIEEAKSQIIYSLPMIFTNLFFYCIPLTSVMFASHLGQLELAGATLANSWATVTGFAFMVGLSGALETLCGQGFGAKSYRTLGIHLQSSCIVSLVFTILISIFWFYTESVFRLLRQDSSISKQAALYMKYQAPGLLAYGLLQNIVRFCQTQSIVMPLVIFSFVPLVINIGTAYVLVYLAGLGFIGAPIATSISLWVAFLSLGTYVICSDKFKETWTGFSLESIRYVVINLTLSLPSAAMVCLEYWAFEILVFLAGLMPNPEITTSLVAICVNTESISYMLTYGLSAAASTRVSNELGAGNVKGAKKATSVTVKLSLVLALCVVLAILISHEGWVGLFSNSLVIKDEFASLRFFLAVSITLDSIQGVLSGVARGCGWQRLVTVINLGTFYLIGMPISAFCGFKLEYYAKGLWTGLICGIFCQSSSLLLMTIFRKWTKLNASV